MDQLVTDIPVTNKTLSPSKNADLQGHHPPYAKCLIVSTTNLVLHAPKETISGEQNVGKFLT